MLTVSIAKTSAEVKCELCNHSESLHFLTCQLQGSGLTARVQTSYLMHLLQVPAKHQNAHIKQEAADTGVQRQGSGTCCDFFRA